MAQEAIVETRRLTKTYRDFWGRQKKRALNALDLQIYRGEIFGLLGPNGSGKTTTIKLLLGLLFPTEGDALVFGEPAAQVHKNERIGYLPEESYLYRFLNAEETLDFYGRLFDMAPAEQFRALQAQKIDLGFVGLRPPAAHRDLQWESIARHRTLVVLPAKHRLARQRQVKLSELKPMFFVGLSEKTHPGFRDWLHETCRPAGFTPRILQDAELEPALMTFVAEGLGVSLLREHIKKLPHPGVALRPLSPAVKTDYCIAWNRDNDSRALQQYIQIVKSLAPKTS